jgi:hypothetical protein
VSDQHCTSLKIPDHLHQNGRQVDQDFGESEVVFHRVSPDAYSQTRIPPEVFRTDNTSVVRQKFAAAPTDALFDGANGAHRPDWGVVQMLVSRINGLTKKHPQLDKTFSFRVVHDPIRCIYPHCEIRAFLDGKEIKEIKPSVVKTWLRDEFSKAATLVHPPQHNGTS